MRSLKCNSNTSFLLSSLGENEFGMYSVGSTSTTGGGGGTNVKYAMMVSGCVAVKLTAESNVDGFNP